MTGHRVFGDVEAHLLSPGEYGKTASGVWLCRSPENAEGRSASGNLGNHTVVEHEDGTITVSPSILQSYGDGSIGWHGYLEKGEWRTV